MWRWPVVIPLVTVALALSPPGRDIIYAALFSGEQLSRNIWWPILLGIIAVLLVLGLVEYGIIRIVNRRRSARAAANKMER